jgi:FlaA1/EpsC-like NDP-sugar epimerase
MIRLAGLEPDIDVPVIFTGIRPGEKLFEEIISEEERRVNQTQWDKIFVTRSEKPADVRALKDRAESLLASLHGDKEGVKRSLDAFIKE